MPILTLIPGGGGRPASYADALRAARDKLDELLDVMRPDDRLFEPVEALRDALALRAARY